MDLNDALSHAKHMTKQFNAFTKLEDVLRLALSSERVIAENENALVQLKVQIADGKSKLDALSVDYNARKKQFDAEYQRFDANKSAAEVDNASSHALMKAEFLEAKRAKKSTYEAEAKTLDLALGEKRKALAEVDAALAVAEEAYEQLKQKFTR